MRLQDIKDWAAQATEGELIHLTNHIYKHYEIIPTKVRHLMLDAVAESLDYKFKYGQKVVQSVDGLDFNGMSVNDVEAGTTGTVVGIDEEDPHLRYLVDFEHCGNQWTREDMLVAEHIWKAGW